MVNSSPLDRTFSALSDPTRRRVVHQLGRGTASVGELAPELPRGWSVPRVRRDYTQRRWAVPAYVGSRYLRARLPAEARAMLGAGHCELVVAHWMIVAPPLVNAVHEAGGELYVWTVDEEPRIRRLESYGVDGIISNDPRLFG